MPRREPPTTGLEPTCLQWARERAGLGVLDLAARLAGFIICLPFVPQSPRWPAKQNRYDEAYDALSRIGEREYAKVELQGIRESLDSSVAKAGEGMTKSLDTFPRL